MSTTTSDSTGGDLAIDENWSAIWDRVATALGDRPAIVTPARTLSYAELEDRASRLARTLRARGVTSGSKVGLFLYNRAEYLETIYAAFKLGAVPVNMNFRYQSEELAALIRICSASALVFPGSLADRVRGAVASLDIALIQVDDSQGEPLDGAIGFEAAMEAEPLPAVPGISGSDEIYMFTGGTTGLPKAAVWLHGQLFDAQQVSLYGAIGLDFPTTLDEVVAIAANPDIPSPRTLPITPLMHAMAMFNSMNTLALGGTVVFLDSPRFDPAATLRTVADERVTRLIIAGNAVGAPLVDELDRAAAAGEPYDVSSLELIMSSGMLWSDECKSGLLRHVDAQLFDIVGSSEGGPYAYSSVWSPGDLPSALRLANGAVVLDESGRELEPDSTGIGVLAYKGAMPVGYFNDPAKTAEVYRYFNGQRYVMPGDYVRLLGAGRIEFLGRGSAVVNTGGEKVYPAEVEQHILAHSSVADCAVFGVDDERWGQVVVAVVEPHAGARIDAELIDQHLAPLIAGYKKPRRIIVVESMGRSPSGKLDLPALVRLAGTLPAPVNH